jgi:hypothetical protein
MIKFLTDGVLIREMMEDPLLTKYRYVHKLAQIAYMSVMITQPSLVQLYM